MSFPQFSNKHLYDSLFSARDHLEYFKKHALHQQEAIPKFVIFCYSRGLFRALCQKYPFTMSQSWGNTPIANLRILKKHNHNHIGLIQAPMGAPMVTLLSELFITLGVKKIVTLGTACSIKSDLESGAIIVCNEAIRDEGVSHHYIETGLKISAKPELLAEVSTLFEAKGISHQQGCSWTTDAPYRETKEEVCHYREQNIFCIDMESAALYALAAKRGISTLSILVISDRFEGFTWIAEFDKPKIIDSLTQCADALLLRSCGREFPVRLFGLK